MTLTLMDDCCKQGVQHPIAAKDSTSTAFFFSGGGLCVLHAPAVMYRSLHLPAVMLKRLPFFCILPCSHDNAAFTSSRDRQDRALQVALYGQQGHDMNCNSVVHVLLC